jgi:anti-anti-sigma factor
LGYTDSAGIGMIISLNGEMEQAGGQMRIAGAQGLVAKSFDIVHMERVIALDANVESGCRALSDGGTTRSSAGSLR